MLIIHRHRDDLELARRLEMVRFVTPGEEQRNIIAVLG